jgi:hypothetical protein
LGDQLQDLWLAGSQWHSCRVVPHSGRGLQHRPQHILGEQRGEIELSLKHSDFWLPGCSSC